jgi:hypothetical protein
LRQRIDQPTIRVVTAEEQAAPRTWTAHRRLRCVTIRVALIAPALFAVSLVTGIEVAAAGRSPLPIPVAGLLPPGTYAATYAEQHVFEPRFTFTADEGWLVGGLETVAIELQDAKFASTDYLLVWNLGDSCRLDGFVPPVPTPHQVMASLETRPFVSAAKPRPARIGGVRGLAIDFTVVSAPTAAPKRPPCVTYLSTVIPGKPFRYAIWYRASKHRLTVLQVRGEIVVIEIVASKADFGRFVGKAEALLRTVSWH